MLVEIGNLGRESEKAQIRHFFPGLEQTLGCLPNPDPGLHKRVYSSLSVAKISSLLESGICKIGSILQKNGSTYAAQQNEEDVIGGCLKGALELNMDWILGPKGERKSV